MINKIRKLQVFLGISIIVGLVILSSTAQLFAVTYYISPDGSKLGDGSRENPWSVETALTRGGSHTYIFLPGLYSGPIELTPKHAGTKDNPTILRSDVKWMAQVRGAQWHNFNVGDKSPHIIIDGFEIWGAGYYGIKSYSDYTTIRNCWIHNNNAIGIGIHNKDNAVIENNLVEFNGMHPQFHHGIYMDGANHVIRGNVVRHNSAFGIHLYPNISQSIIINNLVYGHSNKAGIVIVNNGEKGGLKVINNTVVHNAIGLETWGASEIIIENNILVGNQQTFSFPLSDGKSHYIDYNLYDKKGDIKGSHDVTGDPQFANAQYGHYWLREKSAAIGRGNVDSAPTSDLWGTSRVKDRAPDIGAYQFIPVKFSDEIIKEWQYGSLSNSNKIPDFWHLPINKLGDP